MKVSLVVRQHRRKLASLKRGFADVFVKLCFTLKGFARDFLRIEHANGLSEPVDGHADRRLEVGITADNDSALENIIDCIHQEM